MSEKNPYEYRARLRIYDASYFEDGAELDPVDFVQSNDDIERWEIVSISAIRFVPSMPEPKLTVFGVVRRRAPEDNRPPHSPPSWSAFEEQEK